MFFDFMLLESLLMFVIVDVCVVFACIPCANRHSFVSIEPGNFRGGNLNVLAQFMAPDAKNTIVE